MTINPLRLVARNEDMPVRWLDLPAGAVARSGSIYVLKMKNGQALDLMSFETTHLANAEEVYPYQNPHLRLNFL